MILQSDGSNPCWGPFDYHLGNCRTPIGTANNNRPPTGKRPPYHCREHLPAAACAAEYDAKCSQARRPGDC